ncbi:MAG: phage tail sheath family protein, partial [Burkholderiales bacterium]|nr:phage tail sheath family protein [Burkholderiales bacterium]
AIGQVVTRSANAALTFPRLLIANPLQGGQAGAFAPSGAVAGLFARIDAARGVWKAAAGVEAVLRGVVAPTVVLTDGQQGFINPLGVNCVRQFPAGVVLWGARTLLGDDAQGSEWKYLPVRRLALFLDQSLRGGLGWVVFEPNDEPLWAQVRLAVETFLESLFRRGAFQGGASRDAYFVRCDRSTMSPADIADGRLRVLVGFAPLRPAEFVILDIRQRTAVGG